MPEDEDIDESSDIASENDYDETETGGDDQDDEVMAPVILQRDDDQGANGGAESKKPKLDPKDPLRPRRKKARRACFACQRAHLTCGDERPCQRCIKRGLADACQDGVRKKAKYLHDAPPEALRPVLGPTYNPASNGRVIGPLSGSLSTSDTSPGAGNYFPQVNTSPSYQVQFQATRQPQMPPPSQDSLSYISQQSPISPNFPMNQQSTSMQGLSGPIASTNMDIQDQSAFAGALFDPSNPALFNFDLEGLNFGNHYGALEFGMLNHMSSGAAGTPPQDHSSSMSQQGGSDSNFSTGNMYSNMGQYGQIYPQQDAIISDFASIDRQNSTGTLFDMQRNQPLPRAYVIETGSTSLASPSTTDAQASPQASLGFEGSPTATTYNINTAANIAPQSAHHRHPKRQDSKALAKFGPSSIITHTKRTRDPSSIYSTVTEPYSYTTGFHSLTAFIQRRFSANATLRIAKSLASIRPSFISCTKTLNRQDLIFMEKCFQRTLFEYEEFMRDWGTPTVVCRRTGEVAAVNKEFTLLTNWTKGVLLGNEPNLNINTGRSSHSSSANASGPPSLGNSGRAGLSTPRMRPIILEKGQEGRPQPVFLAELLDNDSVIEFYEDFAKLAFGDSRGSVTKRCKLLKYQTKIGNEGGDGKEADRSSTRNRKDIGGGTMLGGRVSKIDGEFGIRRLERDGKMDCACCWTVKRDVFDIPMLIVMNFLPCI